MHFKQLSSKSGHLLGENKWFYFFVKTIPLLLCFSSLLLLIPRHNKVEADGNTVRTEYQVSSGGDVNSYIWTPIANTTGKYLRWNLSAQNTIDEKTADLSTIYERAVKGFTGTDQTAGTYSGTWGTTASSNYYGGNLRYSTITNNYVEFTFNIQSGQTIGLIAFKTTNAGIGYVTIDGQASLANLLPDDGSGNRYIDFYSASGVNYYGSRQKISIADSLSAGQHTLRLTVSGLKNASSTDYRVYIDGIAVYSTSTSSSDTVEGDFFIESSTLLTADGAWEYAFSIQGAFWGTTTHGNDAFSSLSLTVDGVSQSLAPSTVGRVTGSTIVFTESSTLGSVDYPNVASIQRIYTFTSSGLDLGLTITWNNPLAIATAYQAMFPVLDGSTTSTIGRFEGFNTTYSLTDNDLSYKGNVNTSKIYEYNGTNTRLFSLSVTNLDPNANNLNAHILDGTAPSYNKMYIRRQTGSYTPSVGEVWLSTNLYRVYLDNNAPTGASPSSPANSSYTNQASSTLQWSAGSDAEGGIDHYVLNLDGSDNTIAAGTTTYSTGNLSEGPHNWYVKAYDFLNNYSTTGTYAFTYDATEPTISAVLSTPASTEAAITWTTNEAASSKVDYGLVDSYGNTENNLSLVSAHSITLPNLVECTTYHYSAKSTDAATNEGTSADNTFTTAGCTGSATVESQTASDVTTVLGGSLSLLDSGYGITITIPTSFAGSDANFQIKQLDKTAVINATSLPISYSSIGNYIYDIEALSDVSTTIDSFNHPITVTIAYSASTVSGIDESSLLIYRWDEGSWHVLSNCLVNAISKTVTCTTTEFSVFGLFGRQTGELGHTGYLAWKIAISGGILLILGYILMRFRKKKFSSNQVSFQSAII